jgi:ATP-dependent Clp protease protease subunit
MKLVLSALVGGTLVLSAFLGNKLFFAGSDNLPSKIYIEDNSVKHADVKIENESNKTVSLDRLNLNLERTIFLTGTVRNNALKIAEKITLLNSLDSESPIYLVISSPGGSVITGAAVISAIEASNAPVHTICHIMCASMGAMIHQYGNKRYMTDRSILMFHPAWVRGLGGDVDRVSSLVRTLQDLIAEMENKVAKNVNISFDEYKAEANKELWLVSRSALSRGFVDGLVYIVPENLDSFDNNVGYNGLNEQFKPAHPVDKLIKWVYEGSL